MVTYCHYIYRKATPKIMSTTTPSQVVFIEHIFDEVQPSHDQLHDVTNDKENVPDNNESTPNNIEDNDMSFANQADTIIPTEDNTGDSNDVSTITSEKKQSSIQNWFSKPSSEVPVSSSSSEAPTTSTQDDPLPPSLSSIDHWSEVVMTAPQLTPIELLQRRFLRHTQKVIKPVQKTKPVEKTSHDDVIAGLLLDNDIGQVAHKPGN